MNPFGEKSIFFVVFFYLLSGNTLGFANPQSYESRNSFQPEISASGGPSSVSPGLSGDPTASFFDEKAITNFMTQENTEEPSPLTAGEMSRVEELMGELLSVTKGKSDKDAKSRTEVLREEKSKNVFLRPITFLKTQYDQVKKKMKEPDVETLLSGLKMKEEEAKKTEISESDSRLKAYPEIAENALLEMSLEVTDQVVQANEDFSLAEAHPFMDWLAVKELTEESKRALIEAEAKRKAMNETVEEAEKNGNRVYFIVNGKMVPFFFNIPLFEKGDYKLYVLNDSSASASNPS